MIIGTYVKIFHAHPFAGLCIGQVVEVRPDRLSILIRVPGFQGSRQDLLAVRPGEVEVVEQPTEERG